VRRLLAVIGVLSLLVLAVVGALGYQVARQGISARDQPTWAETVVARRMRTLAVPRATRGLSNPVPATPDVLGRARAHFADHCASCHANDGRGLTPMGQGLYPKAPDMTLAATQGLSDGELFAIIENGVRLTGMPAWGRPGPDDDEETWELVQFIRHLPGLTREELVDMESLNPKSRKEFEEEESVRRFLAGGDPPASALDGTHKH
jgi:mono/diheme cytochrome c family protein